MELELSDLDSYPIKMQLCTLIHHQELQNEKLRLNSHIERE